MRFKTVIQSTAKAFIAIFAIAILAPGANADLQIDANFDSGRIRSYKIDNENNEIEFTLATEKLVNTESIYTYWTNFKVTGVAGKKVIFHITNASRVPFLRTTQHDSQLVYSCDGENWHRLKDHSYSDGIYTFSETFNCNEVQIATFFPFSYEKMREYVEAVCINRWASAEILGYSQHGRDINLLKITDPAIPADYKKVIYIIGRQHAAEVTSSHMLQGMIDFLISDDAYATNFRRKYIWYFVPMVNPDGVYLGNSRATSDLRDPNRDWGNTKSVEVNVVRSHIETIDAAGGIDFFIDWHSQLSDTRWYNYIWAPWRNTFTNVLSDWTDFDPSAEVTGGKCWAAGCVSTQYVMNYTQCDNAFTTEPTPHLLSWTLDTLRDEGVNVAFAIDQYLTMSSNKHFGNTDVFLKRARLGNRLAVPYTMPEDGTITSITMYHEAGDGMMLLGLYADDGKGSPGSRLAVTAESEVSRIEGWQTLELIQPVFAAAGSRIWLGWVYENNPGLRYREGSPARAESDELWDEGMPTTWGPSSLENYIYSIYASYLPRIGVYPLDNDYDNDCDIDGSDLANGGFQDLEDLASNYGLIGCSFDEMNQNK